MCICALYTLYVCACMCTPRHICLGLVLLKVDWALMHHLQFRKWPTYLSTGQCDGVSSSVEVPSFLVTLVCVYSTKSH